MTKKEYMAPEVEIIDEEINQQLLMGSVGIESTPIDADEVEAPEMPGIGGFPFE